MAEAVENASVFLMCVSEKYYLSPNCRLEAEYAGTYYTFKINNISNCYFFLLK